MGYSCTTKADCSLRAIEAALCTGESSNVFERKGRKYFIERGRENADGAITATIMRFMGENLCIKSGSLRIDANGLIVRPVYMREAAYKTGFAKVQGNDWEYAKDSPLLPQLAAAFTTNGVALGDIGTIG